MTVAPKKPSDPNLKKIKKRTSFLPKTRRRLQTRRNALTQLLRHYGIDVQLTLNGIASLSDEEVLKNSGWLLRLKPNESAADRIARLGIPLTPPIPVRPPILYSPPSSPEEGQLPDEPLTCEEISSWIAEDHEPSKEISPRPSRRYFRNGNKIYIPSRPSGEQRPYSPQPEISHVTVSKRRPNLHHRPVELPIQPWHVVPVDVDPQEVRVRTPSNTPGFTVVNTPSPSGWSDPRVQEFRLPQIFSSSLVQTSEALCREQEEIESQDIVTAEPTFTEDSADPLAIVETTYNNSLTSASNVSAVQLETANPQETSIPTVAPKRKREFSPESQCPPRTRPRYKRPHKDDGIEWTVPLGPPKLFKGQLVTQYRLSDQKPVKRSKAAAKKTASSGKKKKSSKKAAKTRPASPPLLAPDAECTCNSAACLPCQLRSKIGDSGGGLDQLL
ncbi:hypothetical protein QAD02_008242 [Eretmocerus hayati]|uniref:Uncharacterized protein n=1 Tax=Eretmocerus hayati TaxID=131215 RepID=A0ACC2N5W1_9HYME|nr:hypothetical protein QAD02_008242 [Eretmocerus hayati]